MTPAQRHNGNDLAILEQRQQVYERARSKHPERWTGQTRDWSPITAVELNPCAPTPHHSRGGCCLTNRCNHAATNLTITAFWSQLRANSSVDLVDVAFEGMATRRRVNLEVSVDGTEGVALGVMSQGELHESVSDFTELRSGRKGHIILVGF